jgi:hypothetical protein
LLEKDGFTLGGIEESELLFVKQVNLNDKIIVGMIFDSDNASYKSLLGGGVESVVVRRECVVIGVECFLRSDCLSVENAGAEI